jgi:hypothetical protein
MCKTLLESPSHTPRTSRNCPSGNVQAVGDYSCGGQVRINVYALKFKNGVNLQHLPEEQRKYSGQYTYNEMKAKKKRVNDAAILSQTFSTQTLVAFHTSYVPEDPVQVQFCTSRHTV